MRQYANAEEVRVVAERLRRGAAPIHPQHVLSGLRAERGKVTTFNGWLADHIVGMAGTMAFFYFLALLLLTWSFWQSLIDANSGFDPYPYSFLFFILGGVMQSLFVPTMLVAQNRAAERDRIKAETDHQSQQHMYEMNQEQLDILRRLADSLRLSPDGSRKVE